MATLNARRRVGTGKGAGRRIRANGMIPAVLYGNKGEAVNLAVEPKALKAILQSPMGNNSMFEVNVDGGETVALARVADFTKHPTKRTLVHCDLQRLDPNVSRTLKVPVRLTGESPAEKIGCRLRFISRVLDVRCLPGDVPEAIEVSIEAVEPGGEIRIASLTPADGLTYLYRDNFPIVTASATAIVWEDEVDDEETEDGGEGEAAAEGDAAAADGGDDS